MSDTWLIRLIVVEQRGSIANAEIVIKCWAILGEKKIAYLPNRYTRVTLGHHNSNHLVTNFHGYIGVLTKLS
jgi:hypothetical protein